MRVEGANARVTEQELQLERRRGWLAEALRGCGWALGGADTRHGGHSPGAAGFSQWN